jgi:predicted MPP superfamily phosphohydrolase
MHKDRMHTTIAGLVVIAVIIGVIAISTTALTSKGSAVQPQYSSSSNRLEFRKSQEERDTDHSYVFHILQIADIHLGENSWTNWGPEQDRKTWIALDRLILSERPDLIVLSGDQITANNVDANATAYYLQLGHSLNTFGIPWALIFGNHDDAPFEKGDANGTRYPAKTSRRKLLEAHRDFDLSLTLPGPESVTGVTNYWLDIFLPDIDDDDDKQRAKVAARVLLLDSGGGTLTEQIDTTQLDWYLDTRPLDLNTPVVAFQHIPSSVQDFAFESTQCKGLQDDGIAGLDNDAGIVEALSDAENVHFLAVGHNHGNDYCCRHTPSLHLCFGRHSGYGGYGRWDRGARVYQLRLNQTGGWTGWKSWVRMESGEVVDEYDPKATTR